MHEVPADNPSRDVTRFRLVEGDVDLKRQVLSAGSTAGAATAAASALGPRGAAGLEPATPGSEARHSSAQVQPSVLPGAPTPTAAAQPQTAAAEHVQARLSPMTAMAPAITVVSSAGAGGPSVSVQVTHSWPAAALGAPLHSGPSGSTPATPVAGSAGAPAPGVATDSRAVPPPLSAAPASQRPWSTSAKPAAPHRHQPATSANLCGVTTAFDPHDAFVGAEEAGSPVPLPALHAAARSVQSSHAVDRHLRTVAPAVPADVFRGTRDSAPAAPAAGSGVTATPPPPRAGQLAQRQPVRAVHDLEPTSHPAPLAVDAMPMPHAAAAAAAAAPFFPASARYMAAAARLAVRGQPAPEALAAPSARSITPGRVAAAAAGSAAGGPRAASMPDLRAEASMASSARSSLTSSHSFHEPPGPLASRQPLIPPAAPLQVPMSASELHSEHRARPSRPRPAAQPDTITLIPINSARSRSRSPL